MTDYYPIVLEREANGTVSAYVVGVPGVYAAADDERRAASAIRLALKAHLIALEQIGATPRARTSGVRVARVTYQGSRSNPHVVLVGPGALLGRTRSAAKAAAARANGRKGGRPRKLTTPARG